MDREVEKSSQMRWVELDSEVWKGFKNLKMRNEKVQDIRRCQQQ